MTFRTADEAMAWVMGRHGKGSGFEVFCELMNSLGNPQDSFKSIHITGTNGKGSTVQFVCDFLMESGFRVGTFTSPHLISHLDRIRINGQWISEEDFLRIVNEYRSQIEKYDLSMFEIDTLISWLYFQEKKVDFAVIEVGIGGRVDSTNCLHHPLVSAIVSIGKDHCEFLGNTEKEIAWEKAGIIKENGCCVVGEMSLEAKEVIQKVARDRKSTYLEARPLSREIELSSNALYQRKNAAVALTIIEELEKKQLFHLSKVQKEKVLKKSFWAGRYEMISDHPKIILDGAHNTAGINALVESLKKEPKEKIIIFSALQDKEVYEMLQSLHKISKTIYVTSFDFYRALPIEKYPMLECVVRCGSFQEAYQKAIEETDENTMVCICGSLYFISEVTKNLKNDTHL